jgi:hypothetical protein
MNLVKEVLAAEIETSAGIPTLKGLEGLFENVVSAILGLAGVVLFIVLVMGGIKYLSSGGDPKAIEEAKKSLTSALIGIVLIASAYLILALIQNITGIDVSLFRIKIPLN